MVENTTLDELNKKELLTYEIENLNNVYILSKSNKTLKNIYFI